MTFFLDGLSRALASCFFLTYPLVSIAHKRRWNFTGSGFIGTLAGVLSLPWLPMDIWPCFCVLGGALLLSVAVSDRAEQLFGQKDDQRIVIDEWAGFLFSMALLPVTPVTIACAFFLFRAADTLKPFGIKYLGRLPGGWGVVMDDIAAGLLANAVLRLLPLS